jgi:GTPase SAR1 family protein
LEVKIACESRCRWKGRKRGGKKEGGKEAGRYLFSNIHISSLSRLWRHYYKDNDALIFVIDSADRARLNEARSELHHLLSEPQLLDSILLIYANKADLPQAISVQEMARLLQLDNVGALLEGGRERGRERTRRFGQRRGPLFERG